MMENEEDNDFIGGTGDDDDTAPPMENEVNNDFIGIGGTGNDDDTAPRPLGARIEVNTDVIGGTGNDEIQLGQLEFGGRGIQDVLAVDVADPDTADGTRKRCSGERQGG